MSEPPRYQRQPIVKTLAYNEFLVHMLHTVYELARLAPAGYLSDYERAVTIMIRLLPRDAKEEVRARMGNDDVAALAEQLQELEEQREVMDRDSYTVAYRTLKIRYLDELVETIVEVLDEKGYLIPSYVRWFGVSEATKIPVRRSNNDDTD